MLAHCFWGDALLIDNLFPTVPLVALLELDLTSPLLVGEDRTAAGGRALQQWADAVAIRRMAVGITASRFQRDTHPPWLHPRLRVLHEGVDLQACAPNPRARLQLRSGASFGAETLLLSFAARSLEPLRGLDRLLAVLPPDQLRDLFRISSISTVHAYLSRPYVPSWSLVEAMACGAAVVAYAGAGVEELIQDGVSAQINLLETVAHPPTSAGGQAL